MSSLERTGVDAPGLEAAAEPVPTMPWRYRHRTAFVALIALIGVLVAGAAAAAIVVLRPFETTADRVDENLASARTKTVETATAARRARKLVEIRAVGADAEKRLDAFDDAIAEVKDTDDPHYVRPAVAALRSERAYVENMAGLSRLTDRRISRWRPLRVGLGVSMAKLDATRPAITDLGLSSGDHALAASAALHTPVDHLDRVLARAGRVLRAWFRRLAIARVAQRRDLATLGAYEAAGREIISRYQGLRADTQRWSDRVAKDGSTYDDAYRYLATAAAARKELRSRLAALSPPPEFASAHKTLVSVLDRSVAAILAAGEGLGQFELDQSSPPADSSGDDPGAYDPGTYDPAPYDPGTDDPGDSDPGSTDPGTDPDPYDPGGYDPDSADPGTDPDPYDPGTDPDGGDPDATGSAGYRFASLTVASAYDDYRDTPGWKNFVSSSDDISSAWASATSAWEGAAAVAEQAIRHRRMPPRPDV